MTHGNTGNQNARKPDSMVRSSRVVVRLTQSQKAALKKLAVKMKMTESELILSRLPEIG